MIVKPVTVLALCLAFVDIRVKHFEKEKEKDQQREEVLFLTYRTESSWGGS